MDKRLSLDPHGTPALRGAMPAVTGSVDPPEMKKFAVFMRRPNRGTG